MRPLTTTDREAIIAYEFSQLGYQEQPPGSNNTKFGAWYGIDPGAWCCMFQSFSAFIVLGFSPFPASSEKGAASVWALVQWAKRTGCWIDGDQLAERGDLVIFTWSGSVPDHIGKVLDVHGVRDIDTIEGNTSDTVALRHRAGSAITGYVRMDWQASVEPPSGHAGPHAQDLGTPPGLHTTLERGATTNNPEAVKYLQRGLNLVLPMWGKAYNVAVSGNFDLATLLGLAAFKRGANDKQWQHSGGHVDHRLFNDPNDGLVGPRTLQYLRLFGLLGPTA